MIISNLKGILDERGLSPNLVVSETGLPRSFIDGLYENNLDRITTKNLNKLCEYLSVSLDTLLFFEPIEIYIQNKDEQYINFISLVSQFQNSESNKKKSKFNFDDYLYLVRPIISEYCVNFLISFNNQEHKLKAGYYLEFTEDRELCEQYVSVVFVFDNEDVFKTLPRRATAHLVVWLQYLFFGHLKNMGLGYDGYELNGFLADIKSSVKHKHNNLEYSEIIQKLNQLEDNQKKIINRLKLTKN